MSAVEDALRRSFLTAGLSDPQLEWLAGRTQQRHYAAGAVVFSEGDPGNALFIIEQGEVRIWVMSPTGQPLTLDTLYDTDPFGGLSLLDGERRSATATVVRDTDVIVLYRDDFMQLIHTEQTALGAVLHNLADMVRSMNRRLVDAVNSSPAVIVSKVLLEYAERHGVPSEVGGVLIQHPLSIADIASLTGLYGQEVERVMEAFQYERVLERGPEYWTVLRLDDLRAATTNPLPRGD